MLGGPDLLWGGIVPGIVAMATLTIVWRSTGKAASAWRTALLLGYVAGQWSLSARDQGAAALLARGELEAAGANWAYDPRNFEFVAAITKNFNASEAHDWLPMLGLLALLPDALACVGKLGPLVGWIFRTALCAFLPWRLLYGSKYLPLSLGPDFDFDLGGWSTGEAIAWCGGLGAVLLIAWQLMRMGHSQEEPSQGNLRSALALVVAFASVITMVGAKSLVLGQLFGVLTAALAGSALGSAWMGTRRGPDAAAGPLVILFGSLLIAGHFFAELTLPHAALLLTAMTLAGGWLPVPGSLSLPMRSVVRVVACLVILAVPVGFAGLELQGQIPETESEQEIPAAPNPYENFQLPPSN